MSDWRIRTAGDAGFVLELAAAIDPRVNDAAIAAAAAVRNEAPAGVRDVLSTYRSVVVHVDPASVNAASVRSLLERAAAVSPVPREGSLVEVPVYYGGRYGPDLETVASRSGLPPHEAVARHAGAEYRVYMLGFLPGFAYMGLVDETIAAPRRDTPRMHVPAGSVGIAGRQTGIYPIDSPGGWQIIGRTPKQVFDARRATPALFTPGDRVRFIPTDPPASDAAETQPPAETAVEATADGITVLRPGLFTTVQDRGRWGWQSQGVPVSGAMDGFAYRAANALVGNPPGAAALEATILGPELRFDVPALVAVTGADLSAVLDGRPLPLNTAVRCRAGSILQFGGRRAGGRTYVAVAGGIDTAPVLGSRSTHTATRMGGYGGRALRAGDRLALAPIASDAPRAPADVFQPEPGDGHSGQPVVLRVLPGPQDDWFPASAFDLLQRTRFLVTPQSDRMGYRLAGPQPLPRMAGREMISDGTFPGAIQVPPSGAPILLMADRQTTGGYPQIAVVISADLPRAGQLVPGDWVTFQLCSPSDARAALATQEERLRALA